MYDLTLTYDFYENTQIDIIYKTTQIATKQNFIVKNVFFSKPVCTAESSVLFLC